MLKRRVLERLLGIFLGVVLGASPAAFGLYGYEPGSPDFTLTVLRDPTPKGTPGQKSGDELLIERLVFDTALGWDFGDRDGYDCAGLEFVDGGEVVIVGRMQNADAVEGRPDNYTEINDRAGHEHNDGPNPIPAPDPLPGYEFCPGNGETPYDGSDHFPHVNADDGPDSVLVRDPSGETRATLDLRHAVCDPAYWAPDVAGTGLWLWWDDDGVSFDGHHDLDCGGGPLEPEPLVKFSFEILEPGWSVCIPDDLAGQSCAPKTTGPTGPTHHETGPTGPTHPTGPSGPGEVVCYSGDLLAEDGSGRTLAARVCETEEGTHG
jgi:hypothetical protein